MFFNTILLSLYLKSKALVRKFSSKRVFLKISRYAQENTNVGVSFWRPHSLQLYEKETPRQLFPCECCEIVKNNFFIEDLWWLLLQRQNNLNAMGEVVLGEIENGYHFRKNKLKTAKKCFVKQPLNPCVPNAPFLDPLKKAENLTVP